MGANATDLPAGPGALPLAGALVVLSTLAACGTAAGEPQTLPAPRTVSAAADVATTPGAPTAESEPTVDIEDDPAVQAVRRYFDAAYRAIEDDDLESQALRDASTAARAEQNAEAFADVVELSAPGPLPFTATAVEETGPGVRTVEVCAYYWGWLRNPGSDEPTAPLEVRAARVRVQDVEGEWKVDDVELIEADCAGVEIREELW